jgi:hypothetical protein
VWSALVKLCVKPLPDDTLSSSSVYPRYRPLTWLFLGLFTGMRQARHGATRHGTVVWPWTAASTTAAACWPWRVKFKVSNNLSESKRGIQTEKKGKVAGHVTQTLRRVGCQTTLPLAFYCISPHCSPGISLENLADAQIATRVINDRNSFVFYLVITATSQVALMTHFRYLLRGCCAVLGTHCDDEMTSTEE